MESCELSTAYPIKSITQIETLDKGKTSEAKLIITTDKRYILRKMRDEKQAHTEYVISKKLAPLNIAPKIMLTKQLETYIKYKGSLYNLQTYINHDNKLNINYFELGKTVSLFHQKVKDIRNLKDQADRFSLDEMIAKLSIDELYKNFTYHSDLAQLIEKSLNYNPEQNTYIHGDLGKWNILFKDEKSYIIDYGEVRKGNNHFDIAAVLDSTIDWKLSEGEILKALHAFRKGYLTHFNPFNWKTLKESIILWTVRGILALFIHYGISDETERYAEETLKKLEVMNGILIRQ